MALVSEQFDDLGLDDPQKKYRLGIMGGTFDPIHIGHLASAEQVRERFNLDAVIFIPAGVPVYKKNKQVSSSDDRFEMCRLAVESNPSFDVSRIEIERPGDTYTVDTLRQLRDHFPPNVELYFITGADAVFSILKWRNAELVVQLAHFIAVARPGYVISDDQKFYFVQRFNHRISYTDVAALAISSTDLRERVKRGASIRYLTMACVRDYIERHGLYLEEGGSCV